MKPPRRFRKDDAISLEMKSTDKHADVSSVHFVTFLQLAQTDRACLHSSLYLMLLHRCQTRQQWRR